MEYMLIVRLYMKTIIFDGSNLLHRSYWVNSVRPTVATEYLFLNSIRKCITKYKSEDILCMWDNRNTRDIKNFRQVLTEHNYKAQRDKKKNVTPNNQKKHKQNNLSQPTCILVLKSLLFSLLIFGSILKVMKSLKY